MNTPLFERYRPSEWSDVVGQDAAVRRICGLGKRAGFSGRSWLITGPWGTGKTTLGFLIAGEVADPMNVEEIDAGDCDERYLARVESTSALYGLGTKPGRAFNVNEVHGLPQPAIRKLLVMLERVPSHVVWVFTTSVEGAEKMEAGIDWKAFQSRSINVELSRRDLATAFASRCRMIAQAEDLDGGADLDRFVALAKLKRNNMRAMLQEIEAGCMLELEAIAA